MNSGDVVQAQDNAWPMSEIEKCLMQVIKRLPSQYVDHFLRTLSEQAVMSIEQERNVRKDDGGASAPQQAEPVPQVAKEDDHSGEGRSEVDCPYLGVCADINAFAVPMEGYPEVLIADPDDDRTVAYSHGRFDRDAILRESSM